jgi:CheY-like chemotaxis protein
MQGMTGIELANKIRKDLGSTINIFLMAAFNISDLKIKMDFQTAKIERIV